ncbi:methyltransferase domain-containing protein [Bacillus swezeyi]|uniref:rRNA (Guanine-N1)-methyltransferase n=1 Tax=Bacillus swezeyi TaxID=1925020 RepID=A0A1R1RYZ7_9BACI|nr:methyltransferase domain-containing protein [Bacillus swezeyi]MEC1260779.1 methyltransferase domain-containing protein [Bacillus swezeyi]MED2928716.1 methyltransferase domain-containing protein [Bacillus swezeyi]MED2943132.1 methyltransferase domain-containing protein [Bacillus swezeyi]MED2964238.1 methyltransferase domain-containing protein [Bacillus swezeyi]MED2976040.1 methyltransferase domain-containing protein [Bacillus swezeyi]
MLNKKMRSAALMTRFETVFQCPLCAREMKVVSPQSLVCPNDHTFDLAKQGYVNVATHSSSGKYDKDLFEARKALAESGFFEPLCEMLSGQIKDGLPLDKKGAKILDAGCGEGSHLIRITEKLKPSFGSRLFGAGIDLSKAGVLAAARRDAELVWLVADLAKAPFQSGTFDVILNILSPSNYEEFTRLLSDEGAVIKVIPKSGYLKELREAFYDEPEKRAYSNQLTVDRFSAHFDVAKRRELSYRSVLDRRQLAQLIRMTPLSWRTDEERIKSYLMKKKAATMSVNLDILIGRKKAK